MIAFKGRAVATMCQPKSHIIWGMQAWFLADSTTGYCYNLDIYSGKETDTVDENINKTHRIVMNMASPCNDVGHHLYFDNYYTSLAVIADLAVKHFSACGTLRVNRKEVPQAVQKAKLKAGMISVFVRQNDVLYISWFDKRQVKLATNLHDEPMFTKQLSGRTANHLLQKPVAIELYTRFMGGVDRADQKLWNLIIS